MKAPLTLTIGSVIACVGAAVPGTAFCQEISRISGRTLPIEYHQRVQRQPDVFELKRGWIQRAERARSASIAVTDTLPLLVVLALFSDSPEPPFSNLQTQQALFDGPSAFGTLSEFYDEVSGGRLGVKGEVLPWVRTSLTIDEVVGGSYGLGGSARTGEYLLEAITAADELVDFGRYDNDGPDGIPNSGDDDRRVDAVAFQFLEIAASCGGPSIWPHRSRIEGWTDDNTPYASKDTAPGGEPILVSDYIVQGATDCGGVEIQKATTIAHELGHVLGLPDLYDRSRGTEPEHRHWVVGCWSLMAAGSWGCGTENRGEWVRPTHMGAWEKSQLGWLSDIQEVGPALIQQVSLTPVISSERVLKIPLETGLQSDTNEYLLLEYRTQEGFDKDLPGPGVLIYHIDPTMPNNQLLWHEPNWYRVALLEADGNSSLQRNFAGGGNRGEPGDAWGVFESRELSHSSVPSSSLNSGGPSHVTIHQISLQDGVATITVSTDRVAQGSLLAGFLGTPAAPLTAEEEGYLDEYGNSNGRYDVGDLRAYLKR